MWHLPEELLSHIIGHLVDSRRTSCKLRLVNKQLCRIVTPILYHTITTWLVFDEFERLKRLAKHPHISQLIKRIIFRPWVLEPLSSEEAYVQAVWRKDRRSRDRQVPDDLNFINFHEYFLKREELPLDSQFELQSKHKGWKGPRAYTQRYLSQGYHLYLGSLDYQKGGWAMTRLVGTLAEYPNLTHVAIVPKAASNKSLIFRRTGIKPVLESSINNDDAFGTFAANLSWAELSLQSLEMILPGYEMEALYAMSYSLSRGEGFARLFGGLRRIVIKDMDLGRCSTPIGQLDAFGLDNLHPVARLIDASPALEKLVLGACDASSRTLPLVNFIPNTHFQQLRFLELHKLSISEVEIRSVLETHASSLCTFNAYQLTLHHGSWISLTDWIRSHLKLHSSVCLGLGELVTGEGLWLRGCFRGYPCRTIAGDVSDYVCNRLGFNPMRRALETGFLQEADAWPVESPLNEGWMPGHVCERCKDREAKSRAIP
ncbi:hypothetical protein MMC13_003143 [Lambiella insularis]|nr:hypothetical protein [Lambiella insularis]